MWRARGFFLLLSALCSACAVKVEQSPQLVERRLAFRRVGIAADVDLEQRNLILPNEPLERSDDLVTELREAVAFRLERALPGIEVVQVPLDPATPPPRWEDRDGSAPDEVALAMARREHVDALLVAHADAFRKSGALSGFEEFAAAGARGGTFIPGAPGYAGVFIPGNPNAQAGPKEGFGALQMRFVDGTSGDVLWSSRTRVETAGADYLVDLAFERFPDPLLGRDVFTACNLFFDADARTTDANYLFSDDDGRITLPVGTRVRVTKIEGEEIDFERAGQPFEVELAYGVERISPSAYFRLILIDHDPLEPLFTSDPQVAAAIREAKLEIGMSKDQAIMARGYPPAHTTPSTDQDEWFYYDAPGTGTYVEFAADRIVRIRAGDEP